jgi:hypothetical protein
MCIVLEDLEVFQIYSFYWIVVYVSKLFWRTSQFFSGALCSNVGLAPDILTGDFLLYFQSLQTKVDATLLSGHISANQFTVRKYIYILFEAKYR